MSFALVYHPLVLSEDIPGLDRRLKDRIAKAVLERLTTRPEAYGKPLRGSLAGYWKLRVGDYRVLYRIVKNEVWIFSVMNRRDVYQEITKRLSWDA